MNTAVTQKPKELEKVACEKLHKAISDSMRHKDWCEVVVRVVIQEGVPKLCELTKCETVK